MRKGARSIKTPGGSSEGKEKKMKESVTAQEKKEKGGGLAKKVGHEKQGT